jgi:hypothetical protein
MCDFASWLKLQQPIKHPASGTRVHHQLTFSAQLHIQNEAGTADVETFHHS